jgi:hypothetical protein
MGERFETLPISGEPGELECVLESAALVTNPLQRALAVRYR